MIALNAPPSLRTVARSQQGTSIRECTHPSHQAGREPTKVRAQLSIYSAFAFFLKRTPNTDPTTAAVTEEAITNRKTGSSCTNLEITTHSQKMRHETRSNTATPNRPIPEVLDFSALNRIPNQRLKSIGNNCPGGYVTIIHQSMVVINFSVPQRGRTPRPSLLQDAPTPRLPYAQR